MTNPHWFATVNHIPRALGIPSVSRPYGDWVLAAGAGVSTSEFRAFLEATEHVRLNEIIATYAQIRKSIRQLSLAGLDSQLSLGFSAKEPAFRNDVLEMVRHLNLKPADAAERIRSKLLAMEHLEPDSLAPFNPKEGLGRWVERVARSVGPSTVLNAAVSAFSPLDANVGEKYWRLSQR
jgi:hypothetical protein